MSQRMHPEDLRALMAAAVFTNNHSERSAVKQADALLAELVHKAMPKPTWLQMVFQVAAEDWDALCARAEAAEAELGALRLEMKDADAERNEARARDPEMPSLRPLEGWDSYVSRLEAWGRQGWATAAALRVEMAETKDSTYVEGILAAARQEERERIIPLLTSKESLLRVWDVRRPGASDAVGWLDSDALRAALTPNQVDPEEILP